jgi:hypothetical protein
MKHGFASKRKENPAATRRLKNPPGGDTGPAASVISRLIAGQVPSRRVPWIFQQDKRYMLAIRFPPGEI